MATDHAGSRRGSRRVRELPGGFDWRKHAVVVETGTLVRRYWIRNPGRLNPDGPGYVPDESEFQVWMRTSRAYESPRNGGATTTPLKTYASCDLALAHIRLLARQPSDHMRIAPKPESLNHG